MEFILFKRMVMTNNLLLLIIAIFNQLSMRPETCYSHLVSKRIEDNIIGSDTISDTRKTTFKVQASESAPIMDFPHSGKIWIFKSRRKLFQISYHIRNFTINNFAPHNRFNIPDGWRDISVSN